MSKSLAIYCIFLVVFSLTIVSTAHLSYARVNVRDLSHVVPVPYYVQEKAYYCGEAALEMVFDYYGSDISQYEIANVARVESGTLGEEMRRAGHFSNLSVSMGDDNPGEYVGYSGRHFGYSTYIAYFFDEDTCISELKSIIDQNYPVIVATWFSTSHNVGHYRVVIGYDSFGIIAHDPYTGASQHYDYNTFKDLWSMWSRWGLFTSPWSISANLPESNCVNSTFTVEVNVTYPCPQPFGYYSEYPADSCNATIQLPPGFFLVDGENLTKTLSDSLFFCRQSRSISWEVLAPQNPGSYSISVFAEGIVHGSAPSHDGYPSYYYDDRIGGIKNVSVNITPQCLVTFNQSGIDTDYTDAIVCIDGFECNRTMLPVTFYWNPGSTHTFNFLSPLAVNSTRQYVWFLTDGLSAIQNGNITITESGHITGIYNSTFSFIADYEASNQDDFVVLSGIHPSGSGANSATGNSFRFSGEKSYYLTLIQLYLKVEPGRNPNAGLCVKLAEHDGTYGMSSTPTSSTLAASETILNSTELTTSYKLYDFVFSNPWMVNPNTAYCFYLFVINATSIDDDNFVNVGRDATSPTYPGNVFIYRHSEWLAFSSDEVIFYIYGVQALDDSAPEINIVSPQNKTYATDAVSLDFTANEATSWIGYSLDGQANVTVTGNTTLAGLLDGFHSIMVYALDVAGNTGHSDMVYFAIDTNSPDISIVSPQNTTYYSSSIPLTFTVDELTSWIGYSLDGQANITASGNGTILVAEGSHWIVMYANDTAGNTGSSSSVYFTVRTGFIDLAVTYLSLSRTVVGEGYPITVNITITNYGDYDARFNVTLYANVTIIYELRDCLIPSGDNLNFSVTWWTTGAKKGYHENSACVSPVSGEIEEANNNLSAGYVLVTLPGDVDGDHDVDIFDIVKMAGIYGVEEPDPRYEANWDIDGDGDIDIFDIVIAAGNYGKSW